MTRKLALLLCLAALPVSAAKPVNIPDWVRAAAATKVPDTLTSTKAIVLLDETAVAAVTPSDISTRWRRVVKITGAAGRDDYNVLSGYFDDETKLVSMKAWAIDPKGLEYETREKEAIESSAYTGELYNDAHVKAQRIPGVDVGSIVAIEIQQRDRPNVMQTTWQFQSDVPVVLARFTIQYAAQTETNWTNHAPVDPVAPGVWELHDVPAIDEEPRRPSIRAIAGRMSINFDPRVKTWADVAKWYASLAFPRNIATPELQAKVRELAPNGATPEAIRAIAHFAQRDIRYVAVEIGIGGYQPHPAGDVFRTRNGDCKDKATLLRTMLHAIGVESHYVLVNTTRGLVDPKFPTSSLFNHAILAIRVPAEMKGHAIVEHPAAGRLMLFDPTSTTTPFGYLPPYLQQNHGLLVTNDGGDLITMPAHPADSNQLRRVAKLQIDANGTLSGHVEELRTGDIAASMRDQLESLGASERQTYIQSMVAWHFTHSSVTALAIDNLDDVDADLVVRYDITAPNYVKRAADLMLVRPRVIGQKPETIVDLAERKNGYVTEGPSLQTDQIEIAMPPSLKLDELPAAVSVKTPALEYASKSQFDAGVLRYERRYALQTFYVPKEKIPELNKAFTQILGDERASAVFK